MKRILEVEFVGGPLDGYREPFGPASPAEVIAWLVSDDTFSLIADKHHRDGVTITSVAIYELELDDGSFRYQFQAATSAREFTGTLSGACIRTTVGGCN
ncbi:MAG: hypothetical protein KDB23_01855 [Planctomycetales bacterium]|nr:hypothetical protein [Planctomycetales bacterium]